MKYWYLQSLGRNNTEAGIGISQDNNCIGFYCTHQLIGFGDNISHCLTKVFSYNTQIMIWLSQAKIIKENLIQLVIIILTCMYKNVVKILVGFFYYCGHLNDFRTSAYNRHQFKFAHIVSSLIICLSQFIVRIHLFMCSHP